METVIKNIRITESALAHLIETKQLVFLPAPDTYTLNGNFTPTIPDYDVIYGNFDSYAIEKMHKLIVAVLDAGMPIDVLLERIMGLQ
jgi:hypothetical protein